MEWVSVKDRLPEEPPTDTSEVTECLVYVQWPKSDPMMLVSQFWSATFSTPDYEERINPYVTHWMPLPEPPK